MLTNKVFFASNKKLCKKENNSLTNLFQQLCTIHMFILVNIVANFVQCAHSYKGTHASCNATNPSNTLLFNMPKSFGMWCSFSSLAFSYSLATTLPSHMHVVPPQLCLTWWRARVWLWVCLVLSQVCAMGEYGSTS
jgi:hypothetical protein